MTATIEEVADKAFDYIVVGKYVLCKTAARITHKYYSL